MSPLLSAIVLLMLALMIAAVVVSYRRTRREIQNVEILEVFDGDEHTQLRLSLRPWMVPRVEKRLKKLGWELAGSRPAASDCMSTFFVKSGDSDAQPLSVVLHRLNRSGFISGAQIDLRNLRKQAEA